MGGGEGEGGRGNDDDGARGGSNKLKPLDSPDLDETQASGRQEVGENSTPESGNWPGRAARSGRGGGRRSRSNVASSVRFGASELAQAEPAPEPTAGAP